MSFKEVYTIRFSDNGRFKKELSVRSLLKSDGKITYYVDIRLKFVDDNGIERFTKRGVTLTLNEFNNILPHMVAFKPYEMQEKTSEFQLRRVSFAKKDFKPYLFELKVNKVQSFTNENQEFSIELINKDIVKIFAVRDQILALTKLQ